MKKILFLLLLGITINIDSKELEGINKLIHDHYFDFYYNCSNWMERLNQNPDEREPQIKKITPTTYVLPLFKAFPYLTNIPHIPFFESSTPITHLQNLENLFPSASIWLKTEDISHLVGLYSGNKRRKLEFEFAQAISRGAKTVITFGYAGSYHCVATAEYAKQLGLHCVCMLKPEINSHDVRKNLLMHQHLGSHLYYFANNEERKRGTLDLLFGLFGSITKDQAGFFTFAHSFDPHPYPSGIALGSLANPKDPRPFYCIPTGGSSARGTIGFVNAAFELKEQIDAGVLPMPDYIYVACGSVATTTGLLLGCKAANLPIKIIAVAIEPEDPSDPLIPQIEKLFVQTNALLHQTDPSFLMFNLNEHDYEINRKFTGDDYGLYTREGNDAKKIFFETEGLKLDGSYTAKATAALLHDLQNGKYAGKKVLFWNTYCAHDFSDRTKNLDYKKLPECFHCYFEQDVQELDRI